MDFLKELFADGALTFEQLQTAVTEKGFKVADLSTGNYVAKKKFEDELATRDSQIGDLTQQLTTRDGDIKNLRKQLEDGGKDNETKISELSDQLSKLQSEYKTAKSDYEAKLNGQAYEFAVKEFANAQNFSSLAAKRDFTREMLSAQLQIKDNTIIGATDFVEAYKQANSDAFVVDTPPAPQGEPKPTFIQPTAPAPTPDQNPFSFNFPGVR